MDKKTISLDELEVLMGVAANNLVESGRYEDGLMLAAADLMRKIGDHVSGTEPMAAEDIKIATLLINILK